MDGGCHRQPVPVKPTRLALPVTSETLFKRPWPELPSAMHTCTVLSKWENKQNIILLTTHMHMHPYTCTCVHTHAHVSTHVCAHPLDVIHKNMCLFTCLVFFLTNAEPGDTLKKNLISQPRMLRSSKAQTCSQPQHSKPVEIPNYGFF